MDKQKFSGEKMKLMITALFSTCSTLIALTPLVYMAYQQIPPQLATIDLQQIVDEDQSQVMHFIRAANGNVSEEKRVAGEKMTADFSQRLSQSVDQLGAECNCILINKAALLSGGAIDYTALLKERMKK